MEQNPTEGPSTAPRPLGTRLDGITDLDDAVRAVREHPGPVEITTGPGRLAGRHLGSVPQRRVGEALREAGAEPLILRAEISIDEDIPDEGVIAVLDDHLSLAAGVGAEYLVVPRAGVGGRSEDRLFSMLAALAEAASAHGVHLLLETEGATADEVALIEFLERSRVEGTLDVDPHYLASVAWNVGASTAAGEGPAAAFERMRPLLDRAPLIVCGVDEEMVEELFAAVPELGAAAGAGRILVVLGRSGAAGA
jgi:sugar phosphate isomerase/epimerase